MSVPPLPFFCCQSVPKIIPCNTVIMQHHDAIMLSSLQVPDSFLTNPQPHHQQKSLLHEHQHPHDNISNNMLCLLERAYLSFKLVMGLHLYNLYSKVYKSFLPFQKYFSFCCSTECQWITICRPCYNVYVFVQHLGLFYCPEEKNNCQ